MPGLGENMSHMSHKTYTTYMTYMTYEAAIPQHPSRVRCRDSRLHLRKPGLGNIQCILLPIVAIEEFQ
jgi:hypothetical protein